MDDANDLFRDILRVAPGHAQVGQPAQATRRGQDLAGAVSGPLPPAGEVQPLQGGGQGGGDQGRHVFRPQLVPGQAEIRQVRQVVGSPKEVVQARRCDARPAEFELPQAAEVRRAK